jgi:hypothetical protein
MKSSRSDAEPRPQDRPESTIDQPPGIFSRGFRYVRGFHRDLFGKLPGAAGLPFRRRLAFRAALIRRKYGWKIVVAGVAYYIIRDVAIYILLPYLVARKVIGG